jgi:putative oxidoreductase
MKLGRLLLRVLVGGFFIGHGTQKLFGWFGGHGLDATAQMFEKLGLRPARHHALAAAVSETGAGALLVTGLATPLAASAITATMLTAVNRVHLKNGPWITKGGYEYNLVLIAAALTLAEIGPGSPAIGGRLGKDWYGPKWALAALLAGAAGAAGAHVYSEMQPVPEPAPPEPGPDTEDQREPAVAQTA